MQIRFVEHFTGFPKLEIMPNGGDWNGVYGRIEVLFFRTDLDTGKTLYNPLVSGNVSFGGSMVPEHADEWGDCFKAASSIANRAIPPYIDSESKNQILLAFLRVDELKR